MIEMDEKVSLKEQMQSQTTGPLILINKFNVEPGEVEQFLKTWQEEATLFKAQSGFISAQLHQSIGGSTVFVNYAVWESLEDFNNAVNNVMSSDAQSQRSQYPKSVTASPHLFKKLAVPRICVGE